VSRERVLTKVEETVVAAGVRMAVVAGAFLGLVCFGSRSHVDPVM
jgi:hypothetical protein